MSKVVSPIGENHDKATRVASRVLPSGKICSIIGVVDDPMGRIDARLDEEEEQIIAEIAQQYPGIPRSLIIRRIIRQFKKHKVPLFDR